MRRRLSTSCVLGLLLASGCQAEHQAPTPCLEVVGEVPPARTGNGWCHEEAQLSVSIMSGRVVYVCSCPHAPSIDGGSR